MNAPLVSVLMTSYNREKYIAEAIESVLASSYTNFELIIVDDRSTDNTVNIAKTFEAKDTRIKIYVNEENLGDYNNRNKAAGYAKGKYLKYLDSDDMIYKYSLAIMVEGIEKYPETGYAFLNYPNQDNRGPFPLLFTPTESYFEHFFNGGFFYAGPGGTIISKSAFDAVGGFSGVRMVGDYELWLKLGAKYNTLKLQPHLIWWRVHEGQEYSIGNKTNIYLRLWHQVTIKALENIDCPLSNKQKQKAVRDRKNIQSRAVIKLLAKGDFKLAQDILKSSSLNYFNVLASIIPVNKIEKLLGKNIY